jgi:HlyD family secretion protein
MNNAGSVIGTIADLSEIIAEVDVDETDVVHVKVDHPAIVKVDALPDEELEGKVIELGSSGVRKQGQEVTVFKVKVLLTSHDERIRPGMSARAHIEVAKHADAVVIPIEAVIKRKKDEDGTDTDAGTDEGKAKKENEADEEDEIKVVFVVDEDEVARRREVETGLSDDTHVEVLAGLEGGEQVVTGPRRVLKRLKDGDSLKPTDPEEEEKKRESEEEEEDEGS